MCAQVGTYVYTSYQCVHVEGAEPLKKSQTNATKAFLLLHRSAGFATSQLSAQGDIQLVLKSAMQYKA